jgi:hypothetical protein
MVIKMEMESHPIEEPPEASIPMEIVSSGGQSAIEEPPEAIIPMEVVSSSSRSATTTTSTTTRSGLVRKVARRTESWYPQPPRRGTRHRQLPTYFASLSPPQADNIPARARKKQRIKEPLPTPKARKISTLRDKAARKSASPTADGDIDDASTDVDPVTDTLPNDGAIAANRRWTFEEDAKLTSGVTNAPKKKHYREYKTDWVAISALIAGRSAKQCSSRWDNFLDPNIDRASGRTGKWTVDEDSKLKDAVQTHGGKNWAATASLVPGRTKLQCRKRWHDVLDPSIGRASGRTGKWTKDEDSKLKNAVRTHGGKNWGLIAALVPGRTKNQCTSRSHDVLDRSIDQANRSTGKWTADEVSKLKDAVRTHGSKDWGLISALVPGRTKRQCQCRWRDVLRRNPKQE